MPFGPHDVLRKSCMDQILDREKVLSIAVAAEFWILSANMFEMSENRLRLLQNYFKM